VLSRLVKFTVTSLFERRYTVKAVHMADNSGSTSHTIISCLGREIFVQINGILTKFCPWKLGVPVIMTHRVVVVVRVIDSALAVDDACVVSASIVFYCIVLHCIVWLCFQFTVVMITTALCPATIPCYSTDFKLVIMVALCNRADHYIFILFLSSFFFFFLA